MINLYPEVTFQLFNGFGGAITEATGSVYQQMSEEQKGVQMDAYFSGEGMLH